MAYKQAVQSEKRAARAAEKATKGRDAEKAFREGNFDQAIRLYTWLLEAAAYDAHAEKHAIWCNRSAALLKVGRYNEAAADARNALPAAPEGSIKAMYRLACAEKAMRRYTVAVQVLDDALEVRPCEAV